MGAVQVIEATRKKGSAKSLPATLRVAAYARVSTDNLEQKTSYDAQISEYTKQISENPMWEMVDIYADEGISGTCMERRVEFQRLLRDCRAGKIDLILVKSISRFSRNVEDCTRLVKELRLCNVDVYFEKEKIHAMDSSSDLIFNVLATFAQQESESISQNITWAIRKKMKDGKMVGGNSIFLGFDYSNGTLQINEEEAETVRYIYHLYLTGKGFQSIANILEKEGRKTAKGAKLWDSSTIQGILCNEKYCGNLIMQKTVVDDFLKHTRKANRGFEDKYSVENHHPAIVSKETFELVQKERERRAKIANGINPDRSQFTVRYGFSEHLVCAGCGDTLKRVHRTHGIGWRCKPTRHGEVSCKAKTVHNSTLEWAFVDIYNEIIMDKSAFFNGFIRAVERVVAKREEKVDIHFLERHISDLDTQIKELVRMKLRKEIDEEFYNQSYQALKEELYEARAQRERFLDNELAAADRNQKISDIRKAIHDNKNPLKSFDEDLFRVLVEKVIIHSPVDFTFVLTNGIERRFDASAYAVEDGRGKWRNKKNA